MLLGKKKKVRAQKVEFIMVGKQFFENFFLTLFFPVGSGGWGLSFIEKKYL